MIRIKCPKCAKPLAVDDDKAGAATKCPECGQAFRVPAVKAGAPADKPASGVKKKPWQEADDSLPAKPSRGDEGAGYEVVTGEPRRARASRQEEDYEEEEALETRLKKKRRKRVKVDPLMVTFFVIVGLDVFTSLLNLIFWSAKANLGYYFNTPLLVFYGKLHIVSGFGFEGTYTAFIIIRLLLGIGLGCLMFFLGNEIARFVLGGLLGVQVLFSVIGLLIALAQAGTPRGDAMPIIWMILWMVFHGALAGVVLGSRGLQDFMATRG